VFELILWLLLPSSVSVTFDSLCTSGFLHLKNDQPFCQFVQGFENFKIFCLPRRENFRLRVLDRQVCLYGLTWILGVSEDWGLRSAFSISWLCTAFYLLRR